MSERKKKHTAVCYCHMYDKKHLKTGDWGASSSNLSLEGFLLATWLGKAFRVKEVQWILMGKVWHYEKFSGVR